MRILMPNTYYYQRGGDCTYTFALTELLESKGHQVIPFAMHHPKNFESKYSKYFADYIDYAESLNSFSIKEASKVAVRAIYSKDTRVKIERMIEEFNPDIAHVQNIHHHLTPSILYALKKANIPIVWTLHDYKLVCPNSTFFYGDSICEKCGKSKYYSTLITKCKKGSISASLMSCIEAYAHRLMKVRDMVDMFVAPSKFLKDKLVERGFDNRKVVHIPNFVNAVAEDHSSASGDYFVYAGRLSSEKGVDTLIQAMAQVSNAKLKIAGDGPMRSTLEVLVSELRLQNVEFLGFIDSETLRKVTIDAQFVVVPSKWYENCPYSILESLALGKPVVGARIGGIPELVDDGKNGFLFEPGNAVDLSAKISILVSDSCLRSKMGLNSLERLQAKYSLNGYYEELSKVYELAKM